MRNHPLASPVRVLCLLAALLLAGCASDPRGDEAPFITTRLVEVDSERFDHLYVNPDVDLARYDGVQVDPPSVAFRDGWRPIHPSIDRPLSREELEQIRADMAERLERQLNRRLVGFTAAGGRPLRLVPALVELSMQPMPRTRTAMSVRMDFDPGSATLLVDLLDPQTGQVVARLSDRKDGPRLPQGGFLTFGGEWDEAVDALFAYWADQLAAWLETSRP